MKIKKTKNFFKVCAYDVRKELEKHGAKIESLDHGNSTLNIFFIVSGRLWRLSVGDVREFNGAYLLFAPYAKIRAASHKRDYSNTQAPDVVTVTKDFGKSIMQSINQNHGG